MPRRLKFGRPLTNDSGGFMAWVQKAFADIERHTGEIDAFDVADGYTVKNVTETRTLDVNEADATDVANFVATFILDLQRRGTRRRV